jgi:hypothetical protein
MKNTNKLLTLALLFAMIFVVSCSKKTDDDPPAPVVPQGDVTATNLVISPDVYVIYDSLMHLVSTNSNLEDGIYKYSCKGIIPQISDNAILVDSANGGYIRKVTQKTISGSLMTFQTTQALLSDVFQEGQLSFTLNPGPSALKSSSEEKTIYYREVDEEFSQGVASGNKVDYSFNSKVAASVTLKGSFHTEPKIHFDFVFDKVQGISKFTCNLDQTKLVLESTAELNVNGNAKYSISYQLCKLQRRAIFWIYGIPVVMDMEFLMTAMGYINFEETAKFPITYTNTSTLGYGITFENGQTTFQTGFSNKSVLSGIPEFTANGQLHLDVVPQINVEFYKVLSNVIKPKPYVDLLARYTNVGGSTQLCAQINGGLDLSMGVSAALFGDTLFNKTKDFNIMKEVLWKNMEGCEWPTITLSNPTFSAGTHTCDPDFYPKTIKLEVDDPDNLMGPGTVLYSIYKFHIPGEAGTSGTITRAWDVMTYEGGTLSYNVCVHWLHADYVEQNVYVKTPDGTMSNVVSVIIPRGGVKSGEIFSGEPGIQ